MALFRSLSGRLLVVTIFIVMLIEIAVFVPSVARFRYDYLSERVQRAEIAALTVLAMPDRLFSPELEAQLIRKAEVLNVVVRREGARELILTSRELTPVIKTFDLHEPMIFQLILDALRRLTSGVDAGVIRVIAPAPEEMGREFEITLNSEPLRVAMIEYGLRILRLSLIISVLTAAVVFLAVRRFVVRPISNVIWNVKNFSQNPEDSSRIITPGSRLDEIADAETAVAEMQRDVHAALRSRARLASLGEAVAKVSHDLRNILSTTQLLADRLEMSEDPVVARTAPKLEQSLGRAIRLCQSTLTYGKAEEAPPETKVVALFGLTEEVADALRLRADERLVSCNVNVPFDLYVAADPEHLYRVMHNLANNAVGAIMTSGKPGKVELSATEGSGTVDIFVTDDGPGIPAKAMENLFKPFQGSTSREGTGLGLAIALELVEANGGSLTLVSSTTAGTTFRISLPSTAAVAAA